MTRRASLGERLTLAIPGVLDDAPSPARVRGGREGLLACIAWERRVDAGLRLALGAGLLRGAWQIGRPTIGYRPDGSPIYGQGAPDFLAVTFDGRPVAIEAKTTADARLPRSSVEPHQADALDAVADAGGLALLAVELRGRGRWVIPWREARWCGPRGGASIGVAELAGWEMLDGLAGYLRRFLGGAR